LVPSVQGFRLASPLVRSPTGLDACGVFFGTSTGNTEEVADTLVAKIKELGFESPDPICVDNVVGSLSDEFAKYENLIVGTPTWNTGAETERSGTSWDEVYYGELSELSIQGKPVAVFGLGDQISYGENYADASGELYDVFSGLSCSMFGSTEVDDSYEHEASKAVKADGRFCGLMCDQVNQDDLTPGRVDKWIRQLASEGFFEEKSTSLNSFEQAPLTKIEGAVADDDQPIKVVLPPMPKPKAREPITDRKGWLGYDNGREVMWVNQENRRESYVTKSANPAL